MQTKLTWCLVGLALLSGCVPSLNPIYTDNDLVFKPEVLGLWKQDKSAESWEFRRRDAKSYRLIYTDRQGHRGAFVAHLADVDGTLFLDLFPEPTESNKPGFHKFHQISIHSIFLVKESGDKVVLSALDYAWLDQYLKDHPAEVSSARFGSRGMITAPTEQLQRFLVDNRARFIHDIQLSRQTEGVVR